MDSRGLATIPSGLGGGVFYNDNQNLYRRKNAFPAGLFEIPLRENLRNTRRIGELTQKFYQGPPMRALGPEGQDLERLVVRDASEIERQVSRARVHLVIVAAAATMETMAAAATGAGPHPARPR